MKLVRSAIATFLLFALCTPFISSAETYFIFSDEETITVSRGVKIYLDNVETNMTDSNGTQVIPFIYNRTAYLPITALENIINKEVSWDENTQSIYLKSVDSESILLSDLETNALIAIDFLILHFKNPNSVQINSASGYLMEYIASDTPSEYQFAFDISAQNGFGGYTRETYYVNVNQASGIPGTALLGEMLYRSGMAENIDVGLFEK